ncbi:M56 family metallopeptidase [Winogradskyella ursingii]|uniref:M56 family metallopeptidase n=1 Tax=Winogradskyella ursingii TaxID=2686079 RepID=UPI0015CB1C6C|nr:M56 family metallopeptidase [Winogradskyella ursingii]
MLYTILQIMAFQALFLMVYDLFLKRETFFNYNRIYLLITSVLSLVLPFIKLPKLQKIAPSEMVIHLPEVFIGTKIPTADEVFVAKQVGIILEQPETPLWQTIFIIGLAVATFIFVCKIAKLFWLKSKNPKRWHGNVLIVNLIKSSAAFSFFNTIFLGERISETERPSIYKHELVHIKEYHTVDLLFFEILKVAMWFNPLIYIYQSRIKELHEYIADSKAVKQNGKLDYYQSLLSQVFDVNNVSFTNTFFKKSLIKKRIAMLQKSKSKQLNLIKYALLIPMVFGMLIYTSAEVRAQEKAETRVENNQELTDEELQQKYYEEIKRMAANNVPFTEIANYAGIKENTYKYIVSREEYLKMNAYMQYIMDQGIQRKSDKGILTDADLIIAESITSKKHKTYKEFRAWLHTDEAKRNWESINRDGILRLYVEDAANKTDEEQKRYESLVKQIQKDNQFNKLIVADQTSTMVLTDFTDADSPSEPLISPAVEIVEVPFSVIEEVPTLPECQDLETNEERKKCMSQFVSKHVNRNFNIGLADSLNLKGRQRIFVSFKIDTNGDIASVRARGPHPELETEAKRVIKTLPQFIPGTQKGKVVTVPYSLPIVFQIDNDDSSNDKKTNDTLSEEKRKELLTKYIERSMSNYNKDAVPFSTVDLVPAYQDCELITDNEERKKCTNSSIFSFVNKNFNTNLAKTLGLGTKKQLIFVQFKINLEGNVTDASARGAHPELEKEAVRVVSSMPKFTPGSHNGKTVKVNYSLPIVFQVAATKKD